jgi:outer membrane receptor protein involved in Fe transport
MRYIGKMFTSLYENFNALNSACPTPGSLVNCPPNNLDAISIRRYPEVFYHDLRLEWNLDRRFQFYVGVDNALNTHPPFGLSGTGNAAGDRGGGTAAIYDAFGRKVYSGFRARF